MDLQNLNSLMGKNFCPFTQVCFDKLCCCVHQTFCKEKKNNNLNT
jgi:hypothetical protein